MDEAALIEDITRAFPYGDAQAATEMIKKACAFSSNAAFTIPYELAVRPMSAQTAVDPETALLLLEIWGKLFEHPLKALVTRFAKAIITREALPLQTTLDAMDVVAKYAGEYQALNVVYFSQRDVPELDDVYAEIQDVWDGA